MKKTISIFSALLITAFSFGQKKELKTAEKALKKGNTVEAKAALSSIESIIDGADAKYKAQYYFLKGQTYQDLAEKGMDTEASLKIAGDAYNKLFEYEKEQKNLKYTKQAKPKLQTLISKTVDKAISAQKVKDFTKASELLHLTYTLQPENKDFLYFAASNSISAKDYDTALKYYEELKEANYTGVRTNYYATNVADGKKESFPDKTIRDLSIKAKTHSNPTMEKTKSRLPEIVKNISWIYTNHIGDNEKALKAVEDAIAINPDDPGLLLTKGNIYYKMGDTAKFKEIMKEIIAKNPNDVDSYYNIGVISAENGDVEEARAAYAKVLELDPGYINAGVNLSKTYLDEASDVVDEMNKLGNSSADNKKFEVLQGQQTTLYRKALKVLEGISVNVPDDAKILKQLKGLYSFLGEDEKFKKVKAKLAELGQ
ncbi:tetratricopeptide repeat protein [Kordia sp. YSTF-M3]|uniref:Tetratricopeptide repeat protein n=1 Tax=Kordia aestuariivivens TaxID=2759037 RepID=A0ABR7Q875_9FLAO|nr:tetratricopeptide repeat protein [Kordia aestuariivivens]MBC8754693.1 tetratricopeptide repeat protein [Kordia aestuariivivens]